MNYGYSFPWCVLPLGFAAPGATAPGERHLPQLFNIDRALLKRGYHGTYHHMSEKHLSRYVGEFSGRHNVRDRNTIDQMSGLARGMVGKRLTYRELVSE